MGQQTTQAKEVYSTVACNLLAPIANYGTISETVESSANFDQKEPRTNAGTLWNPGGD